MLFDLSMLTGGLLGDVPNGSIWGSPGYIDPYLISKGKLLGKLSLTTVIVTRNLFLSYLSSRTSSCSNWDSSSSLTKPLIKNASREYKRKEMTIASDKNSNF